jgi:hypothetical protein
VPGGQASRDTPMNDGVRNKSFGSTVARPCQ